MENFFFFFVECYVHRSLMQKLLLVIAFHYTHDPPCTCFSYRRRFEIFNLASIGRASLVCGHIRGGVYMYQKGMYGYQLPLFIAIILGPILRFTLIE